MKNPRKLTGGFTPAHRRIVFTLPAKYLSGPLDKLVRLFSHLRVITLGNKLKERFAPRRFTLLFHQINDEGKRVLLKGPTRTLCYCHVRPPYAAAFSGFGLALGPAFAFGLATSAAMCLSH
jgi:hypothetical protein